MVDIYTMSIIVMLPCWYVVQHYVALCSTMPYFGVFTRLHMHNPLVLSYIDNDLREYQIVSRIRWAAFQYRIGMDSNQIRYDRMVQTATITQGWAGPITLISTVCQNRHVPILTLILSYVMGPPRFHFDSSRKDNLNIMHSVMLPPTHHGPRYLDAPCGDVRFPPYVPPMLADMTCTKQIELCRWTRSSTEFQTCEIIAGRRQVHSKWKCHPLSETR